MPGRDSASISRCGTPGTVGTPRPSPDFNIAKDSNGNPSPAVFDLSKIPTPQPRTLGGVIYNRQMLVDPAGALSPANAGNLQFLRILDQDRKAKRLPPAI